MFHDINFSLSSVGALLLFYIAEYGCAATTERPFSSVFDIASRSWIPPPAPTSAPSAPTSTPNARALHARPAFFVFCLHLFTIRP